MNYDVSVLASAKDCAKVTVKTIENALRKPLQLWEMIRHDMDKSGWLGAFT